MKFQRIEMGPAYRHGYAEGAVPGIACKVTLQIGKNSWNTTEVELSAEATERVVKAALAEAVATFALDDETIDVHGKPGIPKPEPEPEYYAVAANEVEPL